MKLVVLECRGCGGFFPPKREQVNSMADFFARYGWYFVSYVYLSGTTIAVFREGITFGHQVCQHDFQDVLLFFSEAIDLAYRNTPEDPPVLASHLHFGDNVKVVAETEIARVEESGSFLTAYLMQKQVIR